MILISKWFSRLLILLAVLLAGWTVQVDASAEALIDFIPGRQVYRVAIITPSGVEEYVYHVEFQVNPGTRELKVSTDGPGYTMESRYDADLGLLNSEMKVVTGEDAARVGFDHRVAAFDSVEDKMVLAFYLDGKLQDTREVYLPQQATEVEVLGLYLQALLNQNRTDFHGLILDLNASGRYQLDSRVLTDKQFEALIRQKHGAADPRYAGCRADYSVFNWLQWYLALVLPNPVSCCIGKSCATPDPCVLGRQW